MRPHSHETHPAIVKRLKRIVGHLTSVIVMIEEERECLEIAQQLQAVESAVESAKRTLIHDHLDHCLDLSIGGLSRERAAPLAEFKLITKYL